MSERELKALSLVAEALHRRVLSGPNIWPSSTEQAALRVAYLWGWRPETMPSEDANPNWWRMSGEYRTWLANLEGESAVGAPGTEAG